MDVPNSWAELTEHLCEGKSDLEIMEVMTLKVYITEKRRYDL